MPPQPILDLSLIDPNKVIVDQEGIRKANPQRFEMEQLNGILYINEEKRQLVGFKDVHEDEFWVRGHIPGRPLLPGVLMIEAAAQLASFGTHVFLKNERFMGFGAVDEVKFRDAVIPPAKLILVGEALDVRPRRIVCHVQGFVNNKMVFEAKITGMPM
jgi:3-hydroxyacyl-[acyl-carrier-protein] dehydratase